MPGTYSVQTYASPVTGSGRCGLMNSALLLRDDIRFRNSCCLAAKWQLSENCVRKVLVPIIGFPMCRYVTGLQALLPAMFHNIHRKNNNVKRLDSLFCETRRSGEELVPENDDEERDGDTD